MTLISARSLLPSFTDEEIENYKEAFLEYDVDESGSINIQGESAGDIYLQ